MKMEELVKKGNRKLFPQSSITSEVYPKKKLAFLEMFRAGNRPNYFLTKYVKQF